MIRVTKIAGLSAALALLVGCAAPPPSAGIPTPANSPAAAPAASQVVNVYSARHYGPMENVFAEFTRQTGIEVRISQGSVQSLVERLKAEGNTSPADLFYSIDAGSLWMAAEEGLLQPTDSQVLKDAVPENQRDAQGRWFGISQRARTLVYNPDKVKPEQLSTYAALADPQWKGRLCMRPATHIYTLALVAGMISMKGPDETRKIVDGWVANEPQYIDSDTRIVETVAAGGCDVGIVNSYYLGNLLKANPDLKARLFWANQEGERDGVFMNLTGAGVTASARNKDQAIKLIEWLATRGQAADDTGIPGSNSEYPIDPKTEVPAVLKTFGEFKVNPVDKADYGKFQSDAIKLLQEAGYK
jgi:iron(III) transport system substrate-binding protein